MQFEIGFLKYFSCFRRDNSSHLGEFSFRTFMMFEALLPMKLRACNAFKVMTFECEFLQYLSTARASQPPPGRAICQQLSSNMTNAGSFEFTSVWQRPTSPPRRAIFQEVLEVTSDVSLFLIFMTFECEFLQYLSIARDSKPPGESDLS